MKFDGACPCKARALLPGLVLRHSALCENRLPQHGRASSRGQGEVRRTVAFAARRGRRRQELGCVRASPAYAPARSTPGRGARARRRPAPCAAVSTQAAPPEASRLPGQLRPPLSSMPPLSAPPAIRRRRMPVPTPSPCPAALAEGQSSCPCAARCGTVRPAVVGRAGPGRADDGRRPPALQRTARPQRRRTAFERPRARPGKSAVGTPTPAARGAAAGRRRPSRPSARPAPPVPRSACRPSAAKLGSALSSNRPCARVQHAIAPAVGHPSAAPAEGRWVLVLR